MDAELIFLLETLKSLREESKDIGEEIHDAQDQALPLIQREDPDRDGVDITYKDGTYRAKWQQNAAPEDWDLEHLIPYLKRAGVWDRVKTEILDQAKLEAEIRAGNLSIRALRKFKVKGTPHRPFIRFDEVKRRVIRRKRRR